MLVAGVALEDPQNTADEELRQHSTLWPGTLGRV